MTRDKLEEEYKKLDSRKTEIFHKLQKMYVEQCDAQRYCSVENMIEELSNRTGFFHAIQLVIEYYRICGQQEVLSNLVTDVNVSRKILQSHIYIKGVKVYGFAKNNVYYSYNNILGKSKIHNNIKIS